MAQALVDAGLSESFARAFNEGRVRPRARTPENTTPTRFEEFAEELAQAWRAA